MKDAKRSDFAGFRECKVQRHSALFYLLRVGGFAITVVLPTIFGIWTIANDRPIKDAVLFGFAMVPIGFAGFALSFRAPAFCAQCGRKIEQLWSVEDRPEGRYSGVIAVCRSCKAYEVILSREFD